jgi:hypothetical protein
MAMEVIRDLWWEGDQESLEGWVRICQRDIKEEREPNVAAFILEYTWAALENMRSHVSILPRDAENFHERTMTPGALKMRRRIFGS